MYLTLTPKGLCLLLGEGWQEGDKETTEKKRESLRLAFVGV